MDNKLSQHCILARGYNSPGLLTNSGVSLLMKKKMLFSESFSQMFILTSGSINMTLVNKYDINMTQLSSRTINHQFTLFFYFFFQIREER